MSRFGVNLIVLAVTGGLLSGAALCENDGAPEGMPLLTVPLSVRQAGMGSLSVGGGDVLSAYANPARLVGLANKGEVGLNGGGGFEGTQKSFGLGGGWKFSPNFAAGLFVYHHGISFAEVDFLGNETGGELENNLTSVGITGAYRWEWLRAGLTVKDVREKIMDVAQDVAAVDLGFIADWGDISGGLSFRNLGGRMWEAPEGAPNLGGIDAGGSLPREIRLGVAYEYRPWDAMGGLEVVKEGEVEARFGVGAEWWASEVFALRMGFLSPTGESSGGQAAFGFSGIYRKIGLDYALLTHELGFVNRVSLTYAFGGAMEEQAPEPRREKPAPAARPAGERLNLAIADLSAQGVSSSDAAVVADILRSELVKTGAFSVVEKQNMDKVLAEHAFQQTGCTSEECAVKLGKLLNVQRMSVGSFGKLLDSYFLNLRVVDVETGEIVYGDSVEGKTVSDLKTGVRDLAARMAKQIK